MKIERSGSGSESESESGSIIQRHGSADPDPHQNVMDPQHCGKPYFFTFIYNSVSLHCFIFLFSVMDVRIFNILDNILKFSGKSIVQLYGWTRQSDADSTGSGSSTQGKRESLKIIIYEHCKVATEERIRIFLFGLACKKKCIFRCRRRCISTFGAFSYSAVPLKLFFLYSDSEPVQKCCIWNTVNLFQTKNKDCTGGTLQTSFLCTQGTLQFMTRRTEGTLQHCAAFALIYATQLQLCRITAQRGIDRKNETRNVLL